MGRLLAAVAVLLTSFPAVAAADPLGFQSYQGVRVTGENPSEPPASRPAAYSGTPLSLSYSYIGRDAAEPTIAVDRSGVIFYAAGAFDSVVPGLARQELRRSQDGGRTWETVQAPFVTGQGEVTTLDPFVVGDNSSNRVFAITLLGGGSYLAYTDDAGQTWQESASTSPGANDHQTLTGIRPPEGFPPSSDPKFPNYVYYCVNHVSDARCTRSSDGGQTFQPTGGSPYLQSGEGMEGQQPGVCSALHGHVRGDSEGRVLLPAGHCGLPTLAISEDAGLTWRRSIVSQKIRSATTHTAVAVDRADNLYYLWLDPDHHLPYMAVSTDHGETWGEPLMIAPPGVVEANFPVAVAGEAGRIAINFPGGTGEIDLGALEDYDATAQRPWYTYMVVSTNALDAEPLLLSNTAGPAGDPVHRGNCGPGRCGGMFDFMDIVFSPVDNSVWATATDTCTESAEQKCVSDVQNGRPDDAEGVAVHMVGGPKLIGEGAFGPSPGGAAGPATAKPSPVGATAPAARKVALKCRRTRCAVRLRGAPGGTAVSLRIYRRDVLLAGGSVKLKAGRGTVRLKRGKKAARLPKGKYTVLVTVSRRGAASSRGDRTVKVR
jgi:hypothetical protein